MASLIERYALIGDTPCATDGLLAEEYDPVGRRQLGNFPRAFTHLALVGTALNLTGARTAPATLRARPA